MRKTGGVLNGQLSRVLSETGHTDTIVVTDAGLPIPLAVERVDLALIPGQLPFLAVLDAVLAELEVEGVTIAAEIAEHSPAMLAEIHARFPTVPVETVPHVEFKQRTARARAAVRSGEFTPYANVILTAGVVY